jgi:hypothetical protein
MKERADCSGNKGLGGICRQPGHRTVIATKRAVAARIAKSPSEMLGERGPDARWFAP